MACKLPTVCKLPCHLCYSGCLTRSVAVIMSLGVTMTVILVQCASDDASDRSVCTVCQ